MGGGPTVPTRALRDGSEIPAIGFGTFGSDRYDSAQVAGAVTVALDAGYRLLDCASVYGNEGEVGEAVARALRDGLPRRELFVMSKVWNDAHEPDRTRASVLRSLEDLRLDHLDACFVHWPFPNHHPPHAEGDARDADARPYVHEAFMRTWAALEELVDEGRIRHLGTSNVTIPKLRAVLSDARIAPSLNEMELHPSFQQGELFQFCLDHSIQPVGYSPLGSPSRPDRDRSPGDVVDIEDEAIVAAAAAHGVHPALICLKWAVQRGQVPIPFAVKPEQIVTNLRAVTEDPLSKAEVAAIRAADRNNRLIKGQVFLWPEAESWLDLWDVDGLLPG